jgi:pimeloyl-ACP methyl ester carboxylesterase
MADSDPSAHVLDVPGARLYYERRGSGPLLLMIGSPMDSTGFAGLASAVASDYTVVTYDPRCIGHSSREDTSQDVTPDQQADDVHRLLSALGGGPAAVFGSSGGATVGLALVTPTPARCTRWSPTNLRWWSGRLGTTVAEFPGGHAGFVEYPEQCGRVLHQVLTETPSR